MAAEARTLAESRQTCCPRGSRSRDAAVGDRIDRLNTYQALCAGHMTRPSPTGSGRRSTGVTYCLTGTLVRLDGSWRFLLLHGSEASSSGEQVFR